jgi:IS605 OrfB family transposase
MSLNRIYQGRVNCVEIKNPDREAAKEKPWLLYHSDLKTAEALTTRIPALRTQVEQEIAKRSKLSKAEREQTPKSKGLQEYEQLRDEQRKEWQSILQEHHERFQDAVNYYFAVFAAMVSDNCGHKFWREYREVVERNWKKHSGRKGSWPSPFAAICRAAGLKADASFKEFRDAIFALTGSQATESQRFAALTDLFQAVDKVTQTDDDTENALAGEAQNLYGQEFVTLAAQEMDVPSKVTKGTQKNQAAVLIEKVRAGENLTWNDVFAFKTHPGKKPWTSDQAAAKLSKAVIALIKNLKSAIEEKAKAETTVRSEKGKTGLSEQKKQMETLVASLVAGQTIFEKWLAEKTTILPTDEPTRSGRGAEKMQSAMLLALRPDISAFRDAFLYFNQSDKADVLIEKVCSGSNLVWDDVFAFKKHPGKTQWSPDQAKTKLRATIGDLVRKLEDTEKKTEEVKAKKRIKTLLKSLADGQKEFEQWLENETTVLPADEPTTRTSRGEERLKSAMLFALCPDISVFRETFLFFNPPPEKQTTDPCYEARHAGGIERPVFPQFLDLWCGQQKDKSIGYGKWAHFEKAAFKEAFNKIGQFHLTGRKFDDRLAEANATISAAERELRENPESKLHLIKAVTEDLAEGIVGEDGQERRYTIRDRTLKNWPKVRARWRELLKENANVTAKELVAEKNALQKKLREKFGSAALFEKLAEKNYWSLWNSSDDALDRWVKYEDALEERTHLQKGIKFTPAHPEKSPRYFRWSESSNREHLPWQGMTGQNPNKPKPFTVRVDAFDFERKTTIKLKLHFSAPRLLRNELRKKDEKLDAENPDVIALPPALRAVVEKLGLQSDKHTFAGTSVRLAPVPEDDRNVQLVFEYGFESKQLETAWRRKFPFDGYSSKDKPDTLIGLRWPRENAKPLDWQQNGKVQCLSVDLGINNAAAYQVMRAEIVPSAATEAKGLYHEITPANSPERWRVRSIANGLIRLSGEDAIVYRPEFKNRKPVPGSEAFREELSGSAGRNAQPDETVEAEGWFKDLEKYGDNFHQRHSKGAANLSFPQQNDELLFGLSRLRSQLFRLHRWSEHIFGDDPRITNPAKKQKIRERADKRRADAMAQISELEDDDPLTLLKSMSSNHEALRTKLEGLIDDYLAKFKELLPKFADRILPTRNGEWKWDAAEGGWFSMQLDTKKERPEAWLAGQRGLSYERLRQLKELRQFAQSLNHLCRHKFGRRYMAGRREEIPEPFEGCRQALEDARTDRVKQIAHAIFAAALGVELDTPPADKKEQKRIKSLHGVYRCLERGPVNFIALEQLGDYRTTDRQSRRENRQLAEWRHREIHRVLKELCQLVGMPIVYVKPTNTSRISGKDHSFGFRAEEVFPDDARVANWRRIVKKEEKKEDVADLDEFLRQLESIPADKSLLRPREGGPVFVSLSGDVSERPNSVLAQADLNGAYRIGLRSISHRNCWLCQGMFYASEKPKPSADSQENAPLPKEAHGYFIIDRFKIFDRSATHSGCDYPVIRDYPNLWDLVRGDLAISRCCEINRARIGKWERSKDDVPT